MATIKGITIEIAGNTQPLTKALSEVNRHSRDLQSELRQVDRLLKLDPKNTELMAQKQKILASAVQNSKEKLDTLRQTQSQVNEQFRKGDLGEEQYRAFQREVSKSEQELNKFEKQLKQTSQSSELLTKKLQDTGKKMTDIGKTLTMTVTTPIVGMGALAAKAAIDFESAFAGVRKTVKATEEEFTALKQEIRDMAKTLPASTTEISKVAEVAGMLGIQTEHLMDFSKVMLDLGVTTNLALEDAAMSLSRFANIVQMSQSDFDKLGATVVDLGNNFETTEAEIVEMGLRLAGAGYQIGLSEAQIMALAASLSAVGLQAEMGGSAFSRVMSDMQIAVETGAHGIEDFANVANMSVSEFSRLFKEDAAQAILAFVTGLGKSEEKGNSAIKVLDDMGISEIRLRDALLRTSGASDTLREALELGEKAWVDNIALTKEAGERYGTAASQLQIFKNQIMLLAESFGNILVPALLQIIQPLEKMIEALTNTSESTKKIVVGLALVVAAIGPLTLALGVGLKSITIWTTVIASLKKAMDLWRASTIAQTVALHSLSTALKTTPIGWFITALTLLIPVVMQLNNSLNKTRIEMEAQSDSIKKQIDTHRENINQMEAQSEIVNKLGNEYADLRSKIDSGTLSVIESERAKAQLKAIEERLIPVIGQEGVERLKTANKTGEAVRYELNAIQIRTNTEKRLLQETMDKERERTLGLIYDVEQRIKALDTENRAYTLLGRIREKFLKAGPLAGSWKNRIEELKTQLYEQEREKEKGKLEAYLQQLRESLAPVTTDELPTDELPVEFNIDDMLGDTLDTLDDFQSKINDTTNKNVKSVEKVATVWSNTVNAIKNALNIMQTEHEKEAILAEMQGDKIDGLRLKQSQLNEELGKQREVVAAVRREIQANIEAGVKEGETDEDLIKRKDELNKKLAQEELALTKIEKQIYDTNQAMEEHIRQLDDLSGEITKVEKKYRDEMANALEEYQKKVTEVNQKVMEDERKVHDEYEKLLNDRASSLRDFVGLFDEVTAKEVSGESLLQNLKGQVEAFDNWQENISELAAKGVDQGLIAELREMGPKAGPEIAALNTLTDSQLTEYVGLWRTKNKEAREEAINQLQQQRVEMWQKLAEIRQTADEQLTLYKIEWEKKNAEIRENADKELTQIQEKFEETAKAGTKYGVQLISNFARGMESRFDYLRKVVEEARTIAGELDPTVRHSPSLVDNVKTGLQEIFKAYYDLSKNIRTIDFSGVALAGVPSSVRNNNTNNYGGNTIIFNVTGGWEEIQRELHRRGVRL